MSKLRPIELKGPAQELVFFLFFCFFWSDSKSMSFSLKAMTATQKFFFTICFNIQVIHGQDFLM